MLNIPHCRTTYRQKSFFPRTIPEWNSLPESVVAAPSLQAFQKKKRKAREKKFLTVTKANSVDAAVAAVTLAVVLGPGLVLAAAGSHAIASTVGDLVITSRGGGGVQS
jgi:hypothetical protein